MSLAQLKYTGTVPGTDSNTYVLFSTTAAGWPERAAGLIGGHKLVLQARHSHGGTLNFYASDDRGVNWRQMSTEVIAAPASTDGEQREYQIAALRDFKLEWVNGGTAQSPWLIGMAISCDRAVA